MTEQEVEQRLAALELPDDLEEVALAGGPAPSPAAVARIRQLALERAGIGAPVAHARRRHPWWLVAAAAATVTLLAMALPGPRQALARFLSVIPGIGLRVAGEVQLAAVRPVRSERGADWVEVRGLVTTAGGGTLHLSSHLVRLENVSLADEAGREIKLGASSVGSASNGDSDAWFSFAAALPPGTRQVAVTVRDSVPWHLLVALEPADHMPSATDFGPSVTAAGYTVAGRATVTQGETDIALLVNGVPQGMQIMSADPVSGGLTAAIAGRPLARLNEMQTLTGPLFDYRFAGSGDTAGAQTVTVSLRALEIQETATAKFRLPVRTGDVNRTVAFGHWHLRIARTEVAGSDLKIYATADRQGAAYLERFGRVGGSSWSSEHEEGSMALQSFSVPVPAGATEIAITLADPVVLVEGPWQLEIPLNH